MILSKDTIIGLPVYTQSDDHVGKVADFEVDPELQRIVRYHVRPGDIIRGILQRELLVNSEQVVSITNERMVIEDGTVRVQDQKKVPLKRAVPAT
ncbi:MAG: PRC-barrel domain-containing protein [Patescibacteria group bacterium]